MSNEQITVDVGGDADHKPAGRSWQAATDDQAERIIVGWWVWMADLLKENAP